MKQPAHASMLILLILCCAIVFTVRPSIARTGELSGYLDIDSDLVPISGAGNLDAIDGLSLLGTLYASATQRGLLQLKLSASVLDQAIGGQVEFSPMTALSKEAQCSYQVYSPSGELLTHAHCHEGWLHLEVPDRSDLDPDKERLEVRVFFHLTLKHLLQDGSLELKAEQLRIADSRLSQDTRNGGNEGTAYLPSQGSITEGAGESTYDSYDPFFDTDTADEGCDFDSENDTYDDENYGSDEGVSCESEVDEEGSSSEGCADDEWAAEASTHRQNERSRDALKRWRHLNRLFPLICSLIFVFGWRRLSRLSNLKSALSNSTS